MMRRGVGASTALIVGLWATTVHAQTSGLSSAQVEVTTESVRFDPEQPPTPLDFGIMSPGQSQIVDAGGEGPPSPGAARFYVIGPIFQFYTITLPAGDIPLLSPAGLPGAIVRKFTSSANGPRIRGDGTDQFDVGAEIEIDVSASFGTYTGSFQVTIANQ